MASALTAYNALRPRRRRLVRRVIGTGLRAAVAQPLLRNKIDVGTAAGATGRELANDLLTAYLGRLLGHGQVVVAFGGSGGPYRKPVLQVFSVGGTPLGYVKVGWNAWTRDAVRREAAALRACAGRQLALGVPALLGQSTWHGLDLLVIAPLPSGVRRLRAHQGLPDAGLLREISRLSPPFAGELAASPWWLGLRARISAGVSDPEAVARLTAVADQIERSHQDVTLEFGTWHGDLVPWNLARLGQRLYAWDWESSASDAPLGFDVLHFHFQVSFVAERCELAQAAATALRNARPVLGALGVATETQSLLAILHLFELLVRHEEAHSSTGDVDERFYPAVLGVLEQSLAAASGTAGMSARGWAA